MSRAFSLPQKWIIAISREKIDWEIEGFTAFELYESLYFETS